MNKEAKAAWVTALRSGHWKQGRSSLRWKDEFCCLGVLCDLGEKKDWLEIGGLYYYEGETNYLPEEVAISAGLTRAQQTFLAGMNDDGKSFEEIAEWIEKCL